MCRPCLLCGESCESATHSLCWTNITEDRTRQYMERAKRGPTWELKGLPVGGGLYDDKRIARGLRRAEERVRKIERAQRWVEVTKMSAWLFQVPGVYPVFAGMRPAAFFHRIRTRGFYPFGIGRAT